MASDTESTNSSSEQAPVEALSRVRQAAARARERQKRARDLRAAKGGWRGAIGGFGAASTRFFDRLAANDRRRKSAAILLAIVINFSVLTSLAVFGRVRLWHPDAPRNTISITLVDMPSAPLIPELRDPEITPEPAPEPEPEIIEEPDLELEPEPEPEPDAAPEEPEPETVPEPEPEPEPEPALDLTPDEVFSAPGEEQPEPLIPETAPEAVEEIIPVAPLDDLSQPTDPDVEDSQAPSDVETLLEKVVTEDQQPSGVEDLREDADDGEDRAGEEKELAGTEEELETAPDEEPLTGDDMFDEEPRFGRVMGRSRLPLPTVALPEGEAVINPGSSGVIAVFCPEQFQNADKVAECAGRTQIRSGWRPGSSGEDWTKAAQLLRKDRAEGVLGGGGGLSTVIGPGPARRVEDLQRVQDITDFRRGIDEQTDPVGSISDVDIGPASIEPGWTLRDDPELTQKDLKELEKALKEAEDNK